MSTSSKETNNRSSKINHRQASMNLKLRYLKKRRNNLNSHQHQLSQTKRSCKNKTTEHFSINKSGWIACLKSLTLSSKMSSVMLRKAKRERVLLTFVTFSRIYGNKERICRRINSKTFQKFILCKTKQ